MIKIKNYLILVLKGFLIGIGKIVPGVSGSLIAILLNVYEKGIKIISNPLNNFKDNLKFMLPITCGIVIGINLFSKVIINIINHYYLPTMLLFIGLIIGSIKSIRTKIDEKCKLKCILLIIIISILLSIRMGNNHNHYNFVILIALGFVEAFTMIVPGLSGTAILMTLGYYDLLIKSFSDILSSTKILVPFMIGLLIGIFLTSKIINYCFKHYKQKTYLLIYSLSISSIIILFTKTLDSNYQLKEIIIGLFLLIIGYNITKIIEK